LASTTRASPSRISATWARLRLLRLSLVPARSASRVTTIAPALCRVLPYSSSGLPSPSTIQGPPSTLSIAAGSRRRSSRTWTLALGPVLVLAGALGGGGLGALGGLALLGLLGLLGLDGRRHHRHHRRLGIVEDRGAVGGLEVGHPERLPL